MRYQSIGGARGGWLGGRIPVPGHLKHQFMHVRFHFLHMTPASPSQCWTSRGIIRLWTFLHNHHKTPETLFGHVEQCLPKKPLIGFLPIRDPLGLLNLPIPVRSLASHSSGLLVVPGHELGTRSVDMRANTPFHLLPHHTYLMRITRPIMVAVLFAHHVQPTIWTALRSVPVIVG